MNMKCTLCLLILLYTTTLINCTSKPDNTLITIYCTTDVHGAIYDYDLKKNFPTHNSLANISEEIFQARKSNPNVILLDNGDNLQGQPSNYYYNFIDTADQNIQAVAMNYMQYDASSVGNHDIETGHSVYDRFAQEINFPLLSANIINKATGEPYFTPYTIIERSGFKIAVLGMTTPGVPKWLPEYLWSGMEFTDMVECARKWVPIIEEKENPDVLIGLFHAGTNCNSNGEDSTTYCNENASVLVAQKVDGFDAVIVGHDHIAYNDMIINDAGHKVAIVNAAARATYLGKIDIEISSKDGIVHKKVVSSLIQSDSLNKSNEYTNLLRPHIRKVRHYISNTIGKLELPLDTRKSIFGATPYTDLIHNVQLDATGADISFTSPLQYDLIINKGPITVRDIFNLYPYENGLYVMQLSGNEVIRYLEYSASQQYNTMMSENDHLLKFSTVPNETAQHKGVSTATPYFNYSTAGGIRYTIDIRRPAGQRVSIQGMSDNKPFDPNKMYQVAMTSYQGNGGGGHLSIGVGLSKEEMQQRIIEIKSKDIRFYLTDYINTRRIITPGVRHDFHLIPEKWVEKAKQRDYAFIHGKKW